MSTTLEPGSLVNNRYQIQQVINQAKSERIYLVEDREQYSETCILKKFISIESDRGVIVGEYFQQQLTLLQGLRHPQVQLVKNFFWKGEQLFIVQSYVEGQTYQELLRSGLSLTEPEAIQLLNQILPVLTYLHSQQITHGDISPSHLLLRIHDNLPVLTDFGVMQDIRTQMGVETTETKLLDKVRELPVGFISPGSGEDLYALALTVMMLLTGQDIQVLFNSQTQTWDWERWKLVSDQFAEVLNRMLAVQPTNRFSSADAVLQAINFSPVTNPVPSPISPVPTIPPTTLLSQTTEVSSLLNRSSYQPSTVASQPPVGASFQPEPTNTTASGLKDWQKAGITGGVIGAFILAAVLISAKFQNLPVLKSTPQHTIAQQEISSQQISPSPSISQQSIGWIRIGAVENTSGNASDGEPLISTSQIVTIAPTIVPTIGEQVTVITGVNLRKGAPKPPDYKLLDQVSILQPGQKLIILSLKTFTDPTTSSPYTVVWAEVGLPE